MSSDGHRNFRCRGRVESEEALHLLASASAAVAAQHGAAGCVDGAQCQQEPDGDQTR